MKKRFSDEQIYWCKAYNILAQKSLTSGIKMDTVTVDNSQTLS